MSRFPLVCLALCLFAGSSSVVAQSSTQGAAADQVGFGRALTVGENHVFVGAPYDVNTPGRVYVYTKGEDGKWHESTFLEARKASVGDGFGAALDAAGETLVVGAPAADAVSVFRFDDGEWRQVARLTPVDSTRGFGSSVALVDDQLFVGAETTVTLQDGDTTQTGAVHLFRRKNGTWQATTVLRSGLQQEPERFGRTLLASSEHLLVGASTEQGGAVVAFRRRADGWTQTQTLTADALGTEAQFGAALQWAGDQLLVGAPRAFDATGAVTIYTYSEENAAWTKAGRLLPFGGSTRHFFGTALAFDGTDLWVGAPGAISMPYLRRRRARQRWPRGARGGNQPGMLYHYRRADSTWSGVTRVVHPAAEPGDGLGATVAANASVVTAGLPGDDHGAGTIALYNGADGEWSRNAPIAPAKGAVFSAMTGKERACANGEVGAFSCERVDLKAFLPIQSIGGRRGIQLNDVWGWADPETGTQYALVGRTDGTAFVDVSDPTHPVYVGELPLTDGARVNTWRDIKVYENHAFIVADNAGDHGMQVFDLTRLRTVEPDERPVTFEEDTHYDKVNSVHNLVVNENTGYAYAVGSSGGGTTCGGGLHMINVQDPLNPSFAGCFADPSTGRSGTGYTHDAQCVVYNGPDPEYQGREICVGSNETALSIADVTNEDSTVAISTASYPDYGYVHQGWFGENQRYFYQNDEYDELQGKAEKTRTLVWDLKDLDNPKLVNQRLLSTESSDHNLYVEGSTMYQSNYKSGLRVFDLSTPEAPQEVAHFDTKPYGKNNPGYAGTWSNYPYFDTGIVVVSGIDEGLFVVEKPQQGL